MAVDILAVDFGQQSIRAVVLRRQRKSAIIMEAVEVSVPPGTDHGPAIDAIYPALQRRPQRVVAVSPAARLFTCDLPMPLVQARKLTGEKLEHAACWEVEPYLELPASDCLFNVMLLNGDNARDNSSAAVRVCAVWKETYRVLKHAFQERGMRLQRIYGADTSFAFAGPCQRGSGLDVVVNVRDDASTAAVRKGGDVLVYRSIPLALEQDDTDRGRAESVRKLTAAISEAVKEFGTERGSPGHLLLTGGRADLPGLAEQLASHTSIKTDVWKAQLADGLLRGNAGPQFAPAIGACLQELGLCGARKLGVDDRRPLDQAIRTQVHLVPIAAVLVAALGFGLHYLYASSHLRSLKAREAQMREQKKTLGEDQADVKRAQQEIAALEAKLSAARRQADLVARLAGRAEAPVLVLFKGLRDTIPDDVVLSKIEKQPEGDYLVSGCGLRPSSISGFVDKIGRFPWCESASLDAINEIETPKPGAKTAAKPLVIEGSTELTYSFVVSVSLKAQ